MDYPQLIRQAESRIRQQVLKTPLEYAPILSGLTGAEVYLKLENVQTTGSFKIRGAANKLLSLSENQTLSTVVAASSGNHGIAVAHLARQMKLRALVFVPATLAPTKKELLESLGAELRIVGDDAVEAEEQARAFATGENLPYLSPYNDPLVIAGQGTIGIELEAQLPDMDAVFVPVGGGGLIGGIASWLKEQNERVTIVGCQPKNSAVMYHSVQAGHILDLPSEPTLSDGTAGGVEEDACSFELCRDLVDEWQLLGEDQIAASLRLLIGKQGLWVEGAAALGLAALLKSADRWTGKKVVLILCGRRLAVETFRRISIP